MRYSSPSQPSFIPLLSFRSAYGAWSLPCYFPLSRFPSQGRSIVILPELSRASLVAPGRRARRDGWLLTTRQRKYSGGLFRLRCFVSSHRAIGWASSHFQYWWPSILLNSDLWTFGSEATAIPTFCRAFPDSGTIKRATGAIQTRVSVFLTGTTIGW